MDSFAVKLFGPGGGFEAATAGGGAGGDPQASPLFAPGRAPATRGARGARSKHARGLSRPIAAAAAAAAALALTLAPAALLAVPAVHSGFCTLALLPHIDKRQSSALRNTHRVLWGFLCTPSGR